MLIDSERDRLIVSSRDNRALIAVDLTTGERSVLSDPDTPNVNNTPVSPFDVVYDEGAGYLCWLDGDGAVLAVDIENGDRVFITKGGASDSLQMA